MERLLDGTFTISNEKVNLLEALAMAGDMTVYGLRDNVKLIREDANGKQQIVTLDLNNAETILSPYYWLQQNDIVYITPNKAKARNSDVAIVPASGSPLPLSWYPLSAY